MKYIYYSLYEFYTKILNEQKFYDPIISITGLIALIEVFLLTGLYVFFTNKDIPPPDLAAIIYGIIYYCNYIYFRRTEKSIIEKLDSMSLKNKVISRLFTGLIVFFSFWVFFGYCNVW